MTDEIGELESRFHELIRQRVAEFCPEASLPTLPRLSA
jgi:hypothetical protein